MSHERFGLFRTSMVALMLPAAARSLISLMSRSAVSHLRKGTVGDGIASGDGLMGAGGGGLALAAWVVGGGACTGWTGRTVPAVGGPPREHAGRGAACTTRHRRHASNMPDDRV